MRVATIFAGVPNRWQAGGPLTHWATLTALLDAGHDVVLVSLPWEGEPEEPGRLDAVRELGVEVRVVPEPQARGQQHGRWRARLEYGRTVAWPADAAMFPTGTAGSGLAAVLAEEAPNVVVAHGTPAVTAAYELPIPKLALVSDPPGLTRRLRKEWEPQYPWRIGRDELLYRIGSTTFAYRADRRFVEMLRGFDSVAFFGSHRAEWARGRGVNAWYASSPIVDAAGPEWRERRAAAPSNPRPRILLMGHLRGISTISGLHVFVRDVLPELARALGPDGFEVHIAGKYDPPESLRPALNHPAVKLRGHVEPPDEEFLRAEVVLVPTPVETGPRVRILTAFSYGCCVVAHSANQLGIPALAHDENALLGPSERLAPLTLRALGDTELRARLGAAGRALYESRFTPERAGGRIVDELERISAAVTQEREPARG
jgi:glycosyltransferase involved in cell wall biosynthesis